MIVVLENATGLLFRGDDGDLLEGEIIVVDRYQPTTEYRVVTRVAVVERGPAGSLGIAAGGALEGFDGAWDYLLRWVDDDPAQYRDGRVITIGKPTFYGRTEESCSETQT